ncbi:leukocyte receptor cluster member 1, partial [Pezoporus occidentalis]|uniref:leukocyte receptor cluster member 1 n=1 Tax=Pezoporus occidentalis TaxID=407982 RepID=UPI002F9142E5
EEAERERRKREERARRAEREARTNVLRKKARVGEGSGACPSPHVELFPSPHAGGGVDTAPNREHEEEKRREKERQDRALGLLTFLGQSSAEAMTSPPWYLRPPSPKPLPHPTPPPPKAPPPPKPRPSPSLSRLRQQRLQREAREARRSRELLRGEGLWGEGDPAPHCPMDDRNRPYNSRYHPELGKG